MKQPDIFYHVTSKYNLDSILRKGLKPMIGIHCNPKYDHTRPVIFLTEKNDVDYWLRYYHDTDSVLEVNVSGFHIMSRRAHQVGGNYTEFGCFDWIPPERINVERILEDRKELYQ